MIKDFTMKHTGSIYKTEIFQEVPLLYPEGKCRVVARNVLKKGADQALDTLTSICNPFCSRRKVGGGGCTPLLCCFSYNLVKCFKARYGLAQPSQLVMEKYCKSALASLQGDSEMKSKLMEQQHFVVPTKLTRKDLSSAVVRLAAKRFVGI